MEIRDSATSSTYAIPDAINPPPPEDRLRFLRTLQRVLKEGDFTATYKFALLQALLDIAVESRVRDAAALSVSYRQIAERFVEYYWAHTEPYRPYAQGGGVLAQSTGRQAAVLTLIAFQAAAARLLPAALAIVPPAVLLAVALARQKWGYGGVDDRRIA